MGLRFLGMSDEERLEFEQNTGIKTERLIEEVRAQIQPETEQMVKEVTREVHEIIGPRGTLKRLSAGGIDIGPGMGIRVYKDGTLKTTIEPDGDLLVGSDITDPAGTSMAVFVNDQVYNNEEMGFGDLLIGDNTTGFANIKYNATEGRFEFRIGTTINIFMDTEGALTIANNVTGLSFSATDPTQTMYIKVTDGDEFWIRNSVATEPIVLNITMTDASTPSVTWREDPANTNVSQFHVDEATSGGKITLGNAVQIWAGKDGQETVFNNDSFDIDERHEGATDANLWFLDAGNDRVGIGTNTPGYKLDVNGDVNVAAGSNYKIGGDDFGTLVTNTNDIFRCNSAGAPAFAGTIATLPGGAVLTYNVTSGQENAMVPNSTSQLGKMRLYNTTRGTNALISNCNTGTNTITLTANVPAGWATTDVITIASQTVDGSGAGLDFVDIEITSGELVGKSAVYLYLTFNDSGGAGQQMNCHPFETFAPPNLVAGVLTESTNFRAGQFLYRLVSNVISLNWTASGAATAIPIIRQVGYLY